MSLGGLESKERVRAAEPAAVNTEGFDAVLYASLPQFVELLLIFIILIKLEASALVIECYETPMRERRQGRSSHSIALLIFSDQGRAFVLVCTECSSVLRVTQL
eukprot:4586132-Amphidinium_carterae.1